MAAAVAQVATVVWIQSLALELPHAMGVAKKKNDSEYYSEGNGIIRLKTNFFKILNEKRNLPKVTNV